MKCISPNKEDSEIKREQKRVRREQKERNKDIEKTNKRDFKQEQKIIQLLLLGTGESGKSTISKQMKIIHINGYNEEERKEKIIHIKKNVRDSMACIIAAMGPSKLSIPFENLEKKADGDVLLLSLADADDVEKDKHFQYDDVFFDRIVRLWQDKGVQECYSRSNEYQLIDCAKYFLDKVDDIRDPDYIPSDQDILRCRIMTNNITCIDFEIRDKKQPVQFRVFDVGGQKGERKKWIQLFSNCTAILFLADSSSFDQTLKEDVWQSQPRNRLIEAFDTFQKVWTNRFLQNVSLLLFINKIDRLEEKIRAGQSIATMLAANQQELQQQRSLLNGDVTETAGQTPMRSGAAKVDSTGSVRGRRTAHRHSDGQFSVNEIIEHHANVFSSDPVRCSSADDRREFISSYPVDSQNNESHGAQNNHKSHKKQHHAHESVDVHPDTVKTAVLIKNIFFDITKTKPASTPRYEYSYHTMRYYYTCAVNTNNVEKVLEGCRAFIIERHLERFGIL